jgi:hypothetical protein
MEIEEPEKRDKKELKPLVTAKPGGLHGDNQSCSDSILLESNQYLKVDKSRTVMISGFVQKSIF